jgi:hypothetical protein
MDLAFLRDTATSRMRCLRLQGNLTGGLRQFNFAPSVVSFVIMLYGVFESERIFAWPSVRLPVFILSGHFFAETFSHGQRLFMYGICSPVAA